MCKWLKISESKPPVSTTVLARWANGHVEDCEFTELNGELVHWLSNGEVLDSEPVEWMHYIE